MAEVKETIEDPQKLQGRLLKDEKVHMNIDLLARYMTLINWCLTKVIIQVIFSQIMLLFLSRVSSVHSHEKESWKMDVLYYWNLKNFYILWFVGIFVLSIFLQIHTVWQGKWMCWYCYDISDKKEHIYMLKLLENV